MHDLNAWLCQTDPHNCGRMHDGYDQSSLKNSGELAMCGTSIMRQPPLGQEKKVPKVKEKEKRRNSEKRKEKSRDAARCRRGKESEIFNELLSYLPLTTEVASTLDKMSILRLTLNSLRLEKFVEPTRKSFKDEAWIKFGESDDALCDDPALNFMDGFVMILTDDGEQLEPIFISEGLQLEMGLPVAEMLGVSLETFVHPCDYQELRSVFLGFKDNASEKIEKTMQVRMKCTISAKGRVVNIKSAAYKVVKFQLKVFKRNDVQYMSAICEPMGPCFAKLRPTRRSFLISDVKTGLDFTTQHGLNLVFKSVEGFPEFIGFSADDLKELSLYDLIHPADLFEMSGHFKELFSKGYCDTGFYRFLARCGGYCWISSRAQLVQDTTGKPLTIQCVHYCLGGMIMDSDCVLATFQQPERQQHHLQQQQQQRQQLKDQPARRGLPIGSELTTGSFMDVSLLEDGLREIERQQASAQDFSILCPTQSTTASIPAVPGPLSSSASSSTTTATTTAATTTATTGSASSTTTAATTTTLVDNDSRNKHHVLIFVPSGAGGGQVDSGALNGRSESCLSVSAAPSVPSRHVGGGPSPVAGGRALGFVSFPQQSLRLTATYVNAAELSAGQPSPVAVVGQSKNNQLDNNNTAERAGCTSLQLASFSLAEAAAAAAGASAVEAGSAPAVRGGQVVVQLREKQTPNANQESTIRLSPRVNPSSAVVGCNNDLAAAAAAAAAADSVLLRRPYSTVASVPDGSLISAVSASSSSSSVAAAAAATHALSSSSLPRATNAGVVPTATVAVPSTTTVAAVSGQSRVPSSVTPRSNVEFRCSGAGGQIAAAEATNNVFQDRCPGASVHQRAGSGGNSVLGASFIGVHAAYAQQQILPHQQQRGDGGKQLCADERIVLPGVADCVPDLVSSTDEDDEEDCSGDDCPVLESPASACETTNENRGNYSTDQLDSTNLNLTVATTAAAAAARSACCVDRKQLLGSGNGRNELAYREEQELTSQVPSPKAIVVNDAYDGALIGADHLLGHHHHLHDQLVERQLRNDDATQNLIDSDQSADKWETSIPARASIAAPKRLRGSEPEHTDVDGNDNGCEDFAKTRRLLDTRTSDCEESNPQQSLTSVLTSTLSVFAPRTEEMSPGFLQIKGGQVLTCEEPGADLTHLAPTAGDSAMPLEVEFEVCDEIPENLFPSLLDSAGCSPLSRSPPYEDPLLGYSDLSHALLDDLSMNLQLEADLLPGDWPLPSSSSTSVSNHRDRKSDCRSFRNSNASSTSNNSSKSALTATSKSMLATLLQSEPVPSSVSQKQRAMVHDWGGTTQPLPESMQMSPKRNNTPVKFVPQKVQSTLTINALKRPLSVSQRSSIEQLSQQPQSHTQQQQQQQQQQRSSSACPIKRRKTIDTGELQPKPVEKNGSVLMKLLVSGEDLPNGYSCRVLQGQRPGCHDKDRDLRSAQDYLHSLTSQHDHDPSSVNSDTSDFCHLLSADDDLLMALAAVTQE